MKLFMTMTAILFTSLSAFSRSVQPTARETLCGVIQVNETTKSLKVKLDKLKDSTYTVFAMYTLVAGPRDSLGYKERLEIIRSFYNGDRVCIEGLVYQIDADQYLSPESVIYGKN